MSASRAGSPYLQPDLRRKRLVVTIEGAAGKFTIDGQQPVPITAPTTHLDIPDLKQWSPEAPVLQTLVHESANGETSTIRFGMREFTVKDKRFHLNNRPIALHGIVFGPESVDGCQSDDGARAAVQALKQAGINFVRLRGVAAPDPFVAAATELGVLICDEPQIAAFEASPDLIERCETAVREHILRQRNNTSIVMWHIQPPSGAAAHAEALLKLAHELDPSRAVVAGLDALEGPIRCVRPYQDDDTSLDAVAACLPAPTSNRGEKYYESVGSTQTVSLLSTFGAPPASVPDAAGSLLLERELDGITGVSGLRENLSAMRVEALRLQIQAARVNPKLGGYCMAPMELTALAQLREVQTPIMLAIRAVRTNLVPREEIPVVVSVVNDERIEPQADLSLQVVGPTNQVLWKKKRGVKVPKQTREVWTGTISASGSVGVHKFVVRLMQGMKLLSQNSVEINVVEPVTPTDVDVQVIDPYREWTDRCMALARAPRVKPKVYVVPPLANTIRAYPEVDLMNMLGEVRAGAVALFFGPPADWNDLADRLDEGIRASTAPASDAYHYVKPHPVFDGLPARGLMRHAYRNVVPRKAFLDTSDESICGAFAMRDSEDARVWWGENFLVRRYGAGRLVFTHLRILEYIGNDPVADRLFVNMVKHFGRRSVPSEELAPIAQSALEWLRRERNDRVRLWSVIGPFANWDNAGHETVYPPEQNVNLAGVHAGWRDPVRWTRLYALGEVQNEVDLDDALSPPFVGAASIVPETFYAYAECSAPARQAATLRMKTRASVKVFFNGAHAHTHTAEDESGPAQDVVAGLTLKQGKNTLLLKISRRTAPAQFHFELTSATRDPLLVKWSR